MPLPALIPLIAGAIAKVGGALAGAAKGVGGALATAKGAGLVGGAKAIGTGALQGAKTGASIAGAANNAGVGLGSSIMNGANAAAQGAGLNVGVSPAQIASAGRTMAGNNSFGNMLKDKLVTFGQNAMGTQENPGWARSMGRSYRDQLPGMAMQAADPGNPQPVQSNYAQLPQSDGIQMQSYQSPQLNNYVNNLRRYR